jgi:replicative DNA helicase
MSTQKQYKGGPLSVKNSEVYVIASMMMGESHVISTSLGTICSEDFEIKELGTVFEVISDIYNDSHTVDIYLLSNELKRRGELKNVEKFLSLSDIYDSVVSSANFENHLEEVKKASASRKILLQSKIIQDAIETRQGLDDVQVGVAEINRQLSRTLKRDHKDLKDVILSSWKNFCDYYDGKTIPKIKMQWRLHDIVLGGLGSGQIYVVGARPGMGKTQYAINLARNLGCSGVPVYFKSYEMPELELAERFVNMMTVSVNPGEEIKKKPEEINLEEVRKTYDRALDVVKNANIYIDDSSRDGTHETLAKLRRMKDEGTLGVVIIDYLQLIPKSRAQMRSADPLGEISKEHKAMAKELGVPIIILSQLNREASKRNDKRPKLEDLRESGSIEQDADAVALLHRDDYYVKDAEDSGVMEIIIAKNRHGRTGIIDVYYDRSIGLMAEVDKWGNHER